jgi:ABC-type nitrate/sulfonate/bicarbonate transport system substrate-binding protein
MKTGRIFLALSGVALMLLLACFSHPAWSQEGTALKKIRIGLPNRGVPNLGLMAAQRFGFFRGQGLEAELIVMRPSLSLQTLLAGDLDYSTALASGARAGVSGLPLRIVMALTVGQDFSLVVRAGHSPHGGSQGKNIGGLRRWRVPRRRHPHGA